MAESLKFLVLLEMHDANFIGLTLHSFVLAKDETEAIQTVIGSTKRSERPIKGWAFEIKDDEAFDLEAPGWTG